MAENKVHFGLKNVHYAKITYSSAGVPSWATPIAVPGAVSMTLSKESASTDFYADDIKYYHVLSNNGYTGSLEMASFPPQMRVDIFGETQSSTGKLLIEDVDGKPAEFALMFEIDGDNAPDRYCIMRVQADRPDLNGATKAESVEVQTQTCDITAMAVVDPTSASTINGKVLYRTTAATPTATYNGFFSTVATTFT